jgi:hypothetical protein
MISYEKQLSVYTTFAWMVLPYTTYEQEIQHK